MSEAEQLRAIRERAGLTIREMAKRVPYTEVSLSRYESGTRKVPAGLLETYRDASLAWLAERCTASRKAGVLV